MKKNKAFLFIIVVVLLTAFAVSGCSPKTDAPKTAAPKADAYPGKQPIQVIVPWSAGGGTDLLTRVAVTMLSEKLGATTNVINQPGGQGIPGTVAMLNSKPDGYTLMGDADGSNAIPDAWGVDVPFKAAERSYICRIASYPNVIVVASKTGWKTMDDVANAIKSNPAGIKFGWLGGTAGVDVPSAQFIAALQAKGIDTSKVKMVTFSGGSDLATALAGGHVDVGSTSTTTISSLYKAGKVNIVGVTSAEKTPELPEVATTKEQGWNTVNFMGHLGLAGPKGMSENTVNTLANAMKEAMSANDATAKFTKLSAFPTFLGPKDYAEYIANLTAELKKIKIAQ